MRVEEQNRAAGAGAVALPAELATAAGAPHIAQLNVSRNSRMHIGPQFVTQNVHQDRVVKVRVLGLWLETRAGANGAAADVRRLRCSVAVFICWALVLAGASAIYVAHAMLAPRPHRIDLEASVWRVAWTWVRATSRGERLACAAALVALALCAAAAGVLASPNARDRLPDISSSEWNITRKLWLAKPRDPDEQPYPAQFFPPRIVIIQHTVGPECYSYKDCTTAMQNMQNNYHAEKGYDLPYNFVIGNDARVYEGRGINVVGAHTQFYNNCSVGIAFTGNYRKNSEGGTVLSVAQLDRARFLLAEGARAGWLHTRHIVLGARDVQTTVSPGDVLYAAIRQWPEAPPNPADFFERPCFKIYADLIAHDNATTTALPPS